MEEVKILHCLHSMSWGGLEIYSVDLITRMQTAGFKQKVLCPDDSRVAEELRRRNVDVISFKETRLSKFKHAKMIRRLLQQEDFTHVHSHARLDMWACALALWNTQGVLHFYNLYMNATPKRDLIHKWLFSKVDALISSSQTILNDVKKNFPIDFGKLHLIRYGRDLSLYKHSDEQRRRWRDLWQAENDQLLVGTLCRIDPGKGVKELAKSLDYLNDHELAKVKIVIVGDPTTIGKNADGSPEYEASSIELQKWLDDFSAHPRIQDHLIRAPFQRDYIACLDALDVFALASYNETYSLSVLDAMLMHKPVIGTNAGGTPEQIGSNERGFLAEPKDAESLAMAIRHYLKNREDIPIQGTRAEVWARQEHDWQKVLQQYQNLYRKL